MHTCTRNPLVHICSCALDAQSKPLPATACHNQNPLPIPTLTAVHQKKTHRMGSCTHFSIALHAASSPFDGRQPSTSTVQRQPPLAWHAAISCQRQLCTKLSSTKHKAIMASWHKTAGRHPYHVQGSSVYTSVPVTTAAFQMRRNCCISYATPVVPASELCVQTAQLAQKGHTQHPLPQERATKLPLVATAAHSSTSTLPSLQ